MQEVRSAVVERVHKDYLARLFFCSAAAVTGTFSAYVHIWYTHRTS